LNAREEFALYLEAAGSVGARRRLSAAYGEDALIQARKHWSGRVARFGVARGAVESALGSADAAGPGFLAYRLPGRSGYRYTFALDPASSCVRWSGFEREGPAPDPPRVPSEAAAWPAFAASLATLGATEAELRAWLGEPLDSFGFWPVETWEYPLGVLGLRHGVVESEPGDS
jgi:hypothetical protein